MIKICFIAPTLTLIAGLLVFLAGAAQFEFVLQINSKAVNLTCFPSVFTIQQSEGIHIGQKENDFRPIFNVAITDGKNITENKAAIIFHQGWASSIDAKTFAEGMINRSHPCYVDLAKTITYNSSAEYMPLFNNATFYALLDLKEDELNAWLHSYELYGIIGGLAVTCSSLFIFLVVFISCFVSGREKTRGYTRVDS